MLFSRYSTDGQAVDCTESLSNLYSGSACYVIGSSPSVTEEELDSVRASGMPVLACNLSGRDKFGRWALKPNIWTSYDPTTRFPASIYYDPTIIKFVNHRRWKDLIPGYDDKLCDAPNMFFIENELRSYKDFFDQKHPAVNNAKDSFIQLLDIGYRLGFREFTCVGVSLRIRPSEAQVKHASKFGIDYDYDSAHMIVTRGSETVSTDLLRDFVNEVAKRGYNGDVGDAIKALEQCDREEQYSFGEQKSLSAAMSSDWHYFQTAQYLRLSRKNMRLAGVSLSTSTQDSRLYPFFPHIDVTTDMVPLWNVDEGEDLTGLYCGRQQSNNLPYHKDILPYDFQAYKSRKSCGCGCGGAKHEKPADAPQQIPDKVEGGIALQRTISLPINPPIPINEVG